MNERVYISYKLRIYAKVKRACGYASQVPYQFIRSKCNEFGTFKARVIHVVVCAYMYIYEYIRSVYYIYVCIVTIDFHQECVGDILIIL